MPRLATAACSITRIGAKAIRSLLMHGWPLTADTWDAAAMKLVEAGHRCIFYDRRGFGRSDQPWDGHDYDTYADDVAAVLEDAGVQEKVAWSASRWAAARSRASSPARARTASTRRCWQARSCRTSRRRDDNPDGVPESKLQEMTEQMKTDRAAFMHTFFKTFFGVGMVSSPVSDQVLMNAWRQAMMAGLRPTLAAAKAFAYTDFRPDLKSFDGRADPVHPRDGRQDRADRRHGRRGRESKCRALEADRI